MNKIHEWVNTGLILLVAILVLVGSQSVPPAQVGGASDSGWDATGSGCISVDGTCIIDASGNLDGAITTTADATFGGGANAITVTTSNSATSSMTVGCINMYATSTATSLKFAVPTSANASSTFVLAGTFGTCP